MITLRQSVDTKPLHVVGSGMLHKTVSHAAPV
jgi:hypothetical protein